MTSFNETIMQKCLELASKGLGWTSPNPLVGSVLVKDNEVISEGFHEYFGGAHAEANCLLNLSDPSKAVGGSLFVNLEPCSHFGKTPPCTEIIKAFGIKNVVIGALDPNPNVSGGGAKRLKELGVDVVTGVLEEQCKFLNRRFLKRALSNHPYVILKWAQSLDGFIAPEDKSRVQLSCDESISLVHKWRGEEASIMVGSSTVIHDNPKLTNRSGSGKNPLRIVIDRRGRLKNKNFEIFSEDARTIVFGQLSEQKINLKFSSKSSLSEILQELSSMFLIDSVLVEGGAELINSFIKDGFWDEFRVFRTNKLLHSGIGAPKLPGSVCESADIGSDTLLVGYK